MSIYGYREGVNRMLDMIKRFLKEEDGLGTVEIVIIIAVLVGIALIFRKYIVAFVTNLLNKIFNNPTIDDSIDPTKIQNAAPTPK